MDLKAIINPDGKQSQNNKPSAQSPPTPTAAYRPQFSGLQDGTISPGLASISPHTDAREIKKKRPAENDIDGAPPSKAAKPLPQHPARKRIKPPPIWARPARALPLLAKYQRSPSLVSADDALITNGTSPTTPHSLTIDEGASPGISPYEQTFDNACPSDEVVRYVCDFLFRCLMANEALEASQPDAVPSPNGQLEIEAKIGTLVDRSTNARMVLPVRSEAIINEGLDVSFVSNMTSDQHRRFNDYLNKQVKDSQLAQMPGISRTRSPLCYRRSREVDTFHDLPPAELEILPPAVKASLEANSHRFKPRLRVTRDLQTGRVLAKIIKARIQDLHVYNPNPSFPFDWRISVNVEMNWEGNLDGLLAGPGRSTHQDTLQGRDKNRLSYRHQYSQIDLTQVVPTADAAGRGEGTTHELEIELDSSELKRQYKLVGQGQLNNYENLVRGFVNNVRILSGKGGFLS